MSSYFYHGKKDVSEINVSQGFNKIGDSTFYGFSFLVNVTIPDGIIEIGNYAFAECKALK